MLRVDQVEEQIAERVVAVDATPFDQRPTGSSASAPAFSEADTAVLGMGESRALSHLRFQVLCESAPVDGSRQRPGFPAKVTADVVVRFLYRIRAGSQRADQRLAARAASDVVQAVKALPSPEWAARVLNAWLPTISADGEWLLVDTTYDVTFETLV